MISDDKAGMSRALLCDGIDPMFKPEQFQENVNKG
jgi:hypothetical protein